MKAVIVSTIYTAYLDQHNDHSCTSLTANCCMLLYSQSKCNVDSVYRACYGFRESQSHISDLSIIQGQVLVVEDDVGERTSDICIRI